MIQIQHLTIDLPNFSVSDVSLHIRKGEFFAIMGPTGSGKTLVMESVAGIAPPYSGKILINGIDVTTAPPEDRRVSLVYQDHSLFPHLTVLQNVMYGQRYQNIPKHEGEAIARDLLDTLSLSHAVDRKPMRLSGGEKQRVSIARALACKPDVLLLDEPLSSLDPQFKADFRSVLKDIHSRTGITIIMVTHDFVDALTLAERAAVIHKGKLCQQGNVHDIFHHPVTPFVADFVGISNVLPATYQNGNCMLFDGRLMVPAGGHSSAEKALVAIRPEHVAVREKNSFNPDWLSVSGTLSQLDKHGFAWRGTVRCGNQTVVATLDPNAVFSNTLKPSMDVFIGFPKEAMHYMCE